MLTTAQVKSKEIGDSVSAFQGTVVKIWPRKSGTSDIGPWSFQDVIVQDTSAEEITIKLVNRVPLPGTTVAVYVKAGVDKKGKACDVEIEEYDGKKRIKTNVRADVKVYIDEIWYELKEIEVPKKSEIPTPVASGPTDPHIPDPQHKDTESQETKQPAPIVKKKPNEAVHDLPPGQLIITKSACVKSAADLVCTLIQCGKMELKGTPAENAQTIDDMIKNRAGYMFNACLDVEEYVPF